MHDIAIVRKKFIYYLPEKNIYCYSADWLSTHTQKQRRTQRLESEAVHKNLRGGRLK